MGTSTFEPTVHLTSTTVAQIHVGTEIDEVFASTPEGLRDRIVEAVRLLAASAGEPITATIVEGSSRWPLIVHPDGTYIEATALADNPTARDADDSTQPGVVVGVSSTAATPVVAEAPAVSDAPADAPTVDAEPAVEDDDLLTDEPVADAEHEPEPVPAPRAAVAPAADPVVHADAASDESPRTEKPRTDMPPADQNSAAPNLDAPNLDAQPSAATTRAEATRAAYSRRDSAERAAQPERTVAPRATPTVDDLLSSRDEKNKPRATEGWAGFIRRITGGAISPRPGKAEQSRLDREREVQRRFDGSRTIVILNPKGGAHKTTSTLLLAATFGTQRGGATLAWDNNETRGTLGWRAQNVPHHRTAVDLLENLEDFTSIDQSSLASLDTYVRTQVDARFDVLASDEDAAASSTIDAAAFDRLHRVLSRYYRLLIVDTGNNMRASNWVAAVAAADQLVIVSTVREDTAASAAWLLDGLREKGFDQKIDEAITILAAPSTKPDRKLSERLERHFAQVTSDVVHVPFDAALVDGGPIDFDALSPETRDAWLSAAAAIARRL